MQSVIKYGNRFAVFRSYHSDSIITGNPCSLAKDDINPNTISCGLLSIPVCSMKPASSVGLENRNHPALAVYSQYLWS